jgi:hypothetical protein
MKYVFEVIEEAGSKRSVKDKVKVLKDNESMALKNILAGTFNDRYEWLVPEGKVPFTPCEEHNTPSNLLKKFDLLKFIVKGGPGEKVGSIKRETIFIGLLESIHPKDAELVINMINDERPKGLSEKVIKEAFPDLLK